MKGFAGGSNTPSTDPQGEESLVDSLAQELEESERVRLGVTDLTFDEIEDGKDAVRQFLSDAPAYEVFLTLTSR